MSYHNLMDLHVHSDNSKDAHHSVTLICEKAVNKGLRAVAITDHCECLDFDKFNYSVISKQSAFEVKKSAAVFQGQITLISGIELGNPDRNPEAVKEVLENDFDYVIGAVHRIKGKKKPFKDLDYSRPQNRPNLLMPRYFSDVLELVKWNGFDTLAHLTYPLKYYPPELLADFNIMDYKEEISEILKILIKNGKSLELNTSGEDYIMNGKKYKFHPNIDIIKIFKNLGGEYITVGSSAHNANDVGNSIKEAYDLLKEVGFNYVTLYQRRIPMQIKI